MTGFLLFLGIIALLVLALEPAHRRAGTLPYWSVDGSRDRDRMRIRDDTRMLAQIEPPVRPDEAAAVIGGSRSSGVERTRTRMRQLDTVRPAHHRAEA